MSTFSIILIATAGIAGLIVFFSRTKKILDQRYVLAKRMNRLKINGNMNSIISHNKKLFSLESGYVTPNDVLQYKSTKRQIKAISEYVTGLEVACKQIAKINNNNIKKELSTLQNDIHKYLTSDITVGKVLTVRQVDLLSEIRSLSISIDSSTNSIDKNRLKDHYVLAICLFEKVKNIDAFK